MYLLSESKAVLLFSYKRKAEQSPDLGICTGRKEQFCTGETKPCGLFAPSSRNMDSITRIFICASRTTSADRHALVQLRNLSQNSFYDGWFTSIHLKLIENPLRNDIEQFNAEKKAAEKKLREMQEQMNINEERRNRKLDRIDRLSEQIGMACGSKINLNRPCDAGGYTGPVKQIA